MATVRIRNAVQQDAEILAYIQTESWKAAFGRILTPECLKKYTDREKAEAMYRKVLGENHVRLKIESVDQRPHGICGWGKCRGKSGKTTAELICIHSLADGWNHSYGSVMMQNVLEEMKEEGFSEVILWVFEDNWRARRFYEKHGFKEGVERKNTFGAWERMYRKHL